MNDTEIQSLVLSENVLLLSSIRDRAVKQTYAGFPDGLCSVGKLHPAQDFPLTP